MRHANQHREVTQAMAYPALIDLFDHVGPWTEEDFFALPEDRRIELLDGELLVSPAPRYPHQRLSSRLWSALEMAEAPGFEVLEAVNVRVAPGRILIPDIVVITNPGADLTVSEAADVSMVVEIVSRGGVVADRAVKPQLYAAAGIPHYVRIELGDEGPTAITYRLRGGRYIEFARAGSGERLRLTEPFVIDVDLAELVCRTRPG